MIKQTFEFSISKHIVNKLRIDNLFIWRLLLSIRKTFSETVYEIDQPTNKQPME